MLAGCVVTENPSSARYPWKTGECTCPCCFHLSSMQQPNKDADHVFALLSTLTELPTHSECQWHSRVVPAPSGAGSVWSYLPLAHNPDTLAFVVLCGHYTCFLCLPSSLPISAWLTSLRLYISYLLNAASLWFPDTCHASSAFSLSSCTAFLYSISCPLTHDSHVY